jgi:hypothetical protein
MTTSDKKVKTILIAGVLIYAITVLFEVSTVHSLSYISGINSITSFLLIFYWISKQIHITKHYFELREVSVLLLEILFFSFSIYQIFFNSFNDWVVTFQYIIFGIHFITLILFLIFMMTFKIKKLF